MNKFRGWKQVFSFTYGQNLKSKSYIAVTILIAVILFGLTTVLSVLAAKPEEPEAEPGDYAVYSWVEQVYVLDTTGKFFTDTQEMLAKLPAYDTEYFRDLAPEVVTGMAEEELQVYTAENSEFGIGILITEEDYTIEVKAIVPSTSAIELEEGMEVASLFAECVENVRLAQSGLDEFVLGQLNKEVLLSVSDAGEAESVGVYLIRYFAPAIFGLVLYFLLLFYGQNINREVSTEKTSKLMETLLTSLHPYGLLSGKVFAVVAIAMQQFLLG